MIESMLVADRGAAAARIIIGAQALGIKCVGVGLTHPDDAEDDTGPEAHVDPTRLADDAVLLTHLDELHDPVAVVRAAQAAGVEAVHPGRGPLRASREFADLARAGQLIPIVTEGRDPANYQRELTWAGLTAALVPDGSRLDPPEGVSFHVLVTASGTFVLGSVGLTAAVAPAPGATDRDEALAQAAAAVLGTSGLFVITIDDSAVVGVDPGLGDTYPLIELISGLNLLELQITEAQGSSTAWNQIVDGVAVGRHGTDVVDDTRTLTGERPGLRLEVIPIGGRGHRGLVRAFAWAPDRETAETILTRYGERR